MIESARVTGTVGLSLGEAHVFVVTLRGALPNSVSRVHLGLFADHDSCGSRVVAMDLASTYGLSVRQQAVQCCVLQEGLRLELAEGVSMQVLGVRA